MYKKISVLAVLSICALAAFAQTDNSPYSRYGVGDLLPQQNILNRSMGGVSAAYFDYQSINFANPASFSRLKITTFDFGTEVGSRTLRALEPPRKFNSVSPNISYVQLGFPLSQKRNWGMTFGLRPIARINYDISRSRDMPEQDSILNNFQGNGGAYQAHVGTGIGTKNLSVGINVGYLFGSKNYSTRTTIVADSAFNFYYRSNHSNRTSYGGLMVNGGVQYHAKLNSNLFLQLGAYGNLRRELNATQDIVRETFTETSTGDVQIDSVFELSDQEGKLVYPQAYGLGFILNSPDKWSVGADYTASKWSQYRLFGLPDMVQDSWKIHIGGHVTPNATNPRSYWGRVTYRAGFNFGKDYVIGRDIQDNRQDMPTYTMSFGLGLPMRRAAYTYQSTMINTTFEFGQRGNDESVIRENFFRVSFGLTLSDLWFIKRRYE